MMTSQEKERKRTVVSLDNGDLYCSRCENRYDDQVRVPKLSRCSHVVCSSCLTEVTNCPVCQEDIDASEISTDVYRLQLSRSVILLVDTDSSKFEFLKIIGEGGFGAVWKVKHRVDKSEYAIKKVEVPPIPSGNVGIPPNHLSERRRREITHMSTLRHQNIVSYTTAWLGQELVSKTVCCGSGGKTRDPADPTPPGPREAPRMETIQEEKSFLYIQMELCTKDLNQCIADSLHLDRNRVWKLLEGIINGLQYIHDREIIHRDLKPGNILLDPNDQVKIADFGIARSLTEAVQVSGISAVGCMSRDTGTHGFMAPEVHETNNYTTKADMYSLGVVLSMMLTATRADGFQLVEQIRESASNDTTPSILDVVRYTDAHIIAMLLQDNATFRPDCKKLLRAIEDVDRYVENMNIEASRTTAVDASSLLISLSDYRRDLARERRKRRLTAEYLTQILAARLKMDQSEADWVNALVPIEVLGDRSSSPLQLVTARLSLISEKFEMNEHDLRKTIERWAVAKLGLLMEVSLSVRCPNSSTIIITECIKTGNLYCSNDPAISRLFDGYTSLWAQVPISSFQKLVFIQRIQRTKLLFVEDQYLYIVWSAYLSPHVFHLDKYDLRDAELDMIPLVEKDLDVDPYPVDPLVAVNVDTSSTEQRLIYIMVNRSSLVIQTFTLDGDVRRSIELSWPKRSIWKIRSTKRRVSGFSVNSRGEMIITTWEKERVDDVEIFNVHLFNVNGEYERRIVRGLFERSYHPSVYVDGRDYLYIIWGEELGGRTRRWIDILDPSYKLIGRIRLHDLPKHSIRFVQIRFVQRNGNIVLSAYNGPDRLYILKNPCYNNRS